MKNKKIIVTGGRDYSDHNMVNDVLDFLNPAAIIQGGASGADRLAKQWAFDNNKGVMTYEANWNKHGKLAGPIRNSEMLISHPDAIVLAFAGGKGTENCIKQAKEKNMIILRVEK